MKKKIEKILSILFAFIIIIGIIPTSNTGMTAEAAGGVKNKLDQVISNYPSGSRWTGTFDGGSQCYGFAKLVIYNIFGRNSSGGYRSWSYAGVSTSGMNTIGSISNFSASNVKSLLSNAKCGDVLQFNTTKQHSMVIYSTDSSGVTVYDCNWDNNCGIRKQYVSYGAWSGRNSSKLTLLRSNNYDSINGTSTTYTTGTYKITANSGLRLRSSASTSSSQLELIPYGTIVSVTSISSNWGYTSYNGKSGWICLDYAVRTGDIPQNRTINLHAWLSNSEMGSVPNNFIVKNMTYLCFELTELSSGKRVNDLSSDYDYDVEMIIYKPDGSEAFSYTYENSDYNWIGHTTGEVGLYSAAVKVTGDIEITVDLSFMVSSDAKFTVSPSPVYLNLEDNPTKVVAIDIVGNFPDGAKYDIKSLDESVVGCNHDWSNRKMTLTAKKVGSTDICLYIYDKNMNVLSITKCSVYVSCSHSYDSGKVTKTATCSSTGIKTYTCTKCNATRTETIAKDSANHGNNSTFIKNVKSATCNSYGYTGDKYCSGCNNLIENGKQTEKSAHSYDSGKVTKAATCSSTGIKTYTCKCGATLTTKIEKLNHNYNPEWELDEEPTCSEAGSKSRHCKNCNAKTDIIEIAKINHTYSSWRTTKVATCTTTGTRNRTCSVCGYTVTKKTAALGHDYNEEWIIDKEPTCTEVGSKSYHCNNCDAKSDVTEIKATGHKYKTTITAKATTSKNGTKTTKCSVCGYSYKKTIAKISSVKLSYTSYTYNGNTKTPTVTVKDSNGNTLKKDTDYTVKYSSGRKNVGKYTVTVTFKGSYSGTKTLTFKIKPKSTSISKLTAGTKKFTATWTKQSTQVSGYQLQYSTSSKMTNAKSKTISGTSKTSLTVSGLKAGTKYYVRIRTYKNVKIDGKTYKYYSSWSSVKNVKTK